MGNNVQANIDHAIKMGRIPRKKCRLNLVTGEYEDIERLRVERQFEMMLRRKSFLCRGNKPAS